MIFCVQFFLPHQTWGMFQCCASLHIWMEKKYWKKYKEILEKNSNAIEIDGKYPIDSEGKDFNCFSLYWKRKKPVKQILWHFHLWNSKHYINVPFLTSFLLSFKISLLRSSYALLEYGICLKEHKIHGCSTGKTKSSRDFGFKTNTLYLHPAHQSASMLRWTRIQLFPSIP